MTPTLAHLLIQQYHVLDAACRATDDGVAWTDADTQMMGFLCRVKDTYGMTMAAVFDVAGPPAVVQFIHRRQSAIARTA